MPVDIEVSGRGELLAFQSSKGPTSEDRMTPLDRTIKQWAEESKFELPTESLFHKLLETQRNILVPKSTFSAWTEQHEEYLFLYPMIALVASIVLNAICSGLYYFRWEWADWLFIGCSSITLLAGLYLLTLWAARPQVQEIGDLQKRHSKLWRSLHLSEKEENALDTLMMQLKCFPEIEDASLRCSVHNRWSHLPVWSWKKIRDATTYRIFLDITYKARHSRWGTERLLRAWQVQHR